uniref:hypothetical protein n=1 Tax=Orrella sp. TaxID=1921583 RepID=UPI0040489111
MNTTLTFSDAELAMLGKTADALSAYMGAAVLAEVGSTDGADWVIFGRALGEDDAAEDDMLHVQIGGAESRVLGECGGLDVILESYDCAFLWAIQITDDPLDRFVRLDQDGEVFEAATTLAELLPFALNEPELPPEDDIPPPEFEN